MKRPSLIPAALVLGGVIIAGVAVVADRLGIPVGVLTRDAVTTAELPPYTGAISTFNVMVWSATATLALFLAWTVPGERRRLGLFALLLFALAADDALLLHDVVGPHAGIPEEAFYVVYGLAALAVARAMVSAERTVAGGFWLGAGLLVASGAIDLAFVGQYLFEDGAKLLGSLAWATVPWLTSSVGRPAPTERTDDLAPARLGS